MNDKTDASHPPNPIEIELAQTKAALRFYEERFVKAFRCTPTPINIARVSDGQYLEVNDAWLEATGYERDEVVGRTDMDINIWADAESRRNLLRVFLKTGTARGIEIKYQRKNGEIRYGMLSADILTMGQEPCILAVVNDISDRILTEQALRESEQLFSIAFNASPVAMTIRRLKDGSLVRFNESTMRIFGYAPDEKYPSQIIELHDSVMESALSKQFFENGLINDLETSFKHADGSTRMAFISAKLIEVNGETCILSIINDITEKKQAEAALREANNELENRVQRRTEDLMAANEELQAMNQELMAAIEQLTITQNQLLISEKMASLGNLVAGVAHEVSTPVGVAVTTASHLQQLTTDITRSSAMDVLPALFQEYLEDCREASHIILKNLERAAVLLRSFKQVSVDQSNEVKREFNVKAYLDEILISLHPKLKKTRLKIIINCDEDLRIYSYPGSFAQIITNFIMNSLLHAYDPESSGTIFIKICQLPGQLEIQYADDGKGMEEAVIHRVFDPFFTTKRAAGGTGLGLHIVYNIITLQLGGTIECQSDLHKGTRFIIRFPL